MSDVDLAALGDSVRRKQREAAETQARFVDAHAEAIVQCAVALGDALAQGGRLWLMGNGGSACDAAHFAVEMTHPIVEKRPAYPAATLAADSVLLSAVGNDQDFSLAFVSQLDVFAQAGDVVLGISTSGKSRNVVRGLKRARELDLLTIGFAGRDGGSFPELCDHCFVVESFSTHRIQETHGLLVHLLWDTLHLVRGAEDVLG